MQNPNKIQYHFLCWFVAKSVMFVLVYCCKIFLMSCAQQKEQDGLLIILFVAQYHLVCGSRILRALQLWAQMNKNVLAWI